MAEHVRDAVAEAKRRGDEFLTPRQQHRVNRNVAEGRPSMRELFMGERIDAWVRLAARHDPRLQHITMTKRGAFGPDVIDEATKRWYDITTPPAWQRHVDKYSDSPRLPELKSYEPVGVFYTLE